MPDLNTSQRQHKTTEPFISSSARAKMNSDVQFKAMNNMGDDAFYLLTRMNEQQKSGSSIDSAIAISLFLSKNQAANNDRSA